GDGFLSEYMPTTGWSRDEVIFNMKMTNPICVYDRFSGCCNDGNMAGTTACIESFSIWIALTPNTTGNTVRAAPWVNDDPEPEPELEPEAPLPLPLTTPLTLSL